MNIIRRMVTWQQFILLVAKFRWHYTIFNVYVSLTKQFSARDKPDAPANPNTSYLLSNKTY